MCGPQFSLLLSLLLVFALLESISRVRMRNGAWATDNAVESRFSKWWFSIYLFRCVYLRVQFFNILSYIMAFLLYPRHSRGREIFLSPKMASATKSYLACLTPPDVKSDRRVDGYIRINLIKMIFLYKFYCFRKGRLRKIAVWLEIIVVSDLFVCTLTELKSKLYSSKY